MTINEAIKSIKKLKKADERRYIYESHQVDKLIADLKSGKVTKFEKIKRVENPKVKIKKNDNYALVQS